MPNSEQLATQLSVPLSTSISKDASRGVVWTTLQSLVNRFSGVIVFLVLARLLTPHAFGLLAAAQVFIALSTSFSEAGLTRTLVQRTELRATHLNAALLLNSGAGFILAGLLVGFAPLISRLYRMPALSPVLMLLAVVPLVTALSAVPDSILRRQLKFKTLAMRSTSSVVVGGIVGITAAFLGAGVWALVAQSLTQATLAGAILWLTVRWRPSLRTDRASISELVGFGSHVLGISLLNFLNRRSSEFLIGIFLGPIPLGLFSVGFRVHTMLLDMLVANVQRVALPVFSRLSTDGTRLASAYLRSTALTTTMATPAFTAMALLGPDIVPVLFGRQWQAAGPIMAILALSGPLQSISFFNNSMLLALGRSATALRFTALNATANVLVFASTVHFGIVAVAAGFTVRCWVMAPVGLYLVSRESDVRFTDQLRSLVVPALGALAMTAVVGLARLAVGHGPSVFVLAATGVAALAAYFGVVALVRPRLLSMLLAKLRGEAVSTAV